jgi:hypothetical protein
VSQTSGDSQDRAPITGQAIVDAISPLGSLPVDQLTESDRRFILGAIFQVLGFEVTPELWQRINRSLSIWSLQQGPPGLVYSGAPSDDTGSTGGLNPARAWLNDIEAGVWPRGRHVASRQAGVLCRILESRARAEDAYWEMVASMNS